MQSCQVSPVRSGHVLYRLRELLDIYPEIWGLVYSLCVIAIAVILPIYHRYLFFKEYVFQF